jgi:hypothetical protein
MSLAPLGVRSSLPSRPWGGRGIPAEHAVRGFGGVTLTRGDAELIGEVLSDGRRRNDLGRAPRRPASRTTARLAAYSQH